MRQEWANSYSERYDSPFTAYLDSLLMEGGQGMMWGDIEGPGLVCHVEGRHFVHCSSQGFVTHFKMERTDNKADEALDDFVRLTFPDCWDWEEALRTEADS